MDAEKPTIVVVDDAPDVRLLLKTRLRVSGAFRVVGEGADGAQAVQLAERHRPSLMLLDVSMPVMDGLEALPKVLAVSPNTKVVVFSGFEEQGLVEKARQLGASVFIEKSEPVDSLIERLVAVVSGEVRGHEVTTATATGDEVAVEGSSGVDGEPRHLRQEVLEEHLERFREVFEEAAIGMATMTLSGRLARVNRALAHLVHVPAAELVGSFYGELTDGHGEIVSDALDDIRRRGLDVVQLEHGVRGAHDNRWVRATLAPVRDSGGRPLYVFLQLQDITAQRAAAEELRRSEERFRLLVEAVEEYAIFMLDPHGHIASWNSGAQRSKGYTAEEIIGQHFRVFYPPEVAARKHPEHELEIAVREGHYEEEGWRLRKDGTRFWANVLITAVFNEAGEHIGFTKVTRDTTERRQLEEEREEALRALAAANAELESLNQRLQQSAEDQSQFLAVTAHELRTPIGVLGGSAQTLSQHWADLEDTDRSELLDAMVSSTARLRRLLADLLTASRLQASALDLHAEPVRAMDVVADVVATAHRTAPDAEVVVDVPEDLAIAADRDRLAQSLDNLLGNALRHGEPPVRVSACVAPNAPDMVQIRVSDHGPGVDATMQPRLFGRFATGRARGGTGLGLFIVRELARAHGGDAFYEPASQARPHEPAGAFVVTVPLAASKRT